MPATPVNDHTAEFEQLAGLSALDMLEGDERVRFDQHHAQCARCQLMVRLDRQALSRMPLTAPEMDPSPDFKARLMQRAAAELAAAPRLAEVPGPVRRPIPIWRRRPLMSGLAAVFALALVTGGAFTYQNQPVAHVELHGDAPGSATVIVRRSGAAELEMRGVPDPGPGFVYEAWIIPPDKQPVAAATVSQGTASVALEGDARGSTVAITREPGRLNAPTGAVLMKADVQS